MKGGTVKTVPVWEIPRSAITKLVIQLLYIKQSEEKPPLWAVDVRKHLFIKKDASWRPLRGATIYHQEIDEVIEGLREAQKELQGRIGHAESDIGNGG